MANASLSPIAQPLAVVAHVRGQSLRALPLSPNQVLVGRGFRIDRRTPRELRRNFDHRLVDEDGDWVEVARMGFQTQPLRFERQCTAPENGS